MSVDLKIEIKWHATNNDWSFDDVEFSWINKDNEQCTNFTFCKDYLQDQIQSYLFNISTVPSYNPQVHPEFSLDKTRLLVHRSCQDYVDNLHRILELLHECERRLKMNSLTKIYKVSNPIQRHGKYGSYVFVGHPYWTISPPMISMYALFIKCGTRYDSGDTIEKYVSKMKDNSEIGSMNSYCFSYGEYSINRILRHGNALWYKDRKRNFSDKIDQKLMHKLGLCGMRSEYLHRKYVPRWSRCL